MGQLGTLIRKISDHHTMLVASGVAFSCLVGLIPSMIALVSVYGLVASPDDVESNLRPLVSVLPNQASELVIEALENVTAINTAEITLSLAIGLLGMAWAVSGAMNSIVMAIRIAHEMPSPHNWIQGRMFALRLSVVGIVATAAMIWLVVALPPVLDRISVGGQFRSALAIGRWPLVAFTTMTALALLYRSVVGRRSGRFPTISVGAVVGTATWMLSTYGLGVSYDNVGRLETTFGSLGAVAALMAWLYLSAFAALLGAEVDGMRHRHKQTPAVPLAGPDVDATVVMPPDPGSAFAAPSRPSTPRPTAKGGGDTNTGIAAAAPPGSRTPGTSGTPGSGTPGTSGTPDSPPSRLRPTDPRKVQSGRSPTAADASREEAKPSSSGIDRTPHGVRAIRQPSTDTAPNGPPRAT